MGAAETLRGGGSRRLQIIAEGGKGSIIVPLRSIWCGVDALRTFLGVPSMFDSEDACNRVEQIADYFESETISVMARMGRTSRIDSGSLMNPCAW